MKGKLTFGHDKKIRQESDFYLFRSAKVCLHSQYFLIKIKKNTNNTCPRMAVIVNKKIGHAVYRNRIKRLFREIFRLAQYKLNKHNDYLIIARKGILDNYHLLQQQVHKLLKIQ